MDQWPDAQAFMVFLGGGGRWVKCRVVESWFVVDRGRDAMLNGSRDEDGGCRRGEGWLQQGQDIKDGRGTRRESNQRRRLVG